ncbi:MAG: hypothetical protein KBC69_01810 [Candidatus Magasanikbacteria bacterium]|nr:hypothetical protein [Candidatus Magasanikbacteria bacterium]
MLLLGWGKEPLWLGRLVRDDVLGYDRGHCDQEDDTNRSQDSHSPGIVSRHERLL